MTNPLFSVRRDWPSVCHESPLPKIEAVKDLILDEFLKAISVAFHTFHQRRADMRDIKAAHEGDANVLTEVQNRVTDAYKKVIELYKFIPVYGSSHDKVEALTAMLFLDTIKEVCVNRSTKLLTLLRSPKHQADLKVCKEKVEELDALADWGNALDYFLGTTQAAKLEKLKAITLAEDNYLYTWFTTYKNYVTKKVENPALQEQPKELASPPVQADTLLPEEKFRTGQFLSSYRYSEVQDVATQLGSIEAEIKKLEAEGFTRMRSACGGDVSIAIPQLPIEAINRSFASLLNKPFSTHVHAAWYYEDAVRTHAQEVSDCFQSFQTNLVSNFGQKCRAIRAFKVYSETTVDKIGSFYEVLNMANIDPVIDQTILREGVSLLQLTPEEAALPKHVLGRTKSLKELGETALNYLLKGFIRNIHFQKDYEFEAVIAMLQTDPAYRTDFKACIEANVLLKKLYEIYPIKTPQGVMELLHELYEPLPNQMSDAAQVMRLFHLEKAYNLLAQRNEANSWLESKIKQLRVDLGPKVDVSSDAITEPAQRLYKNLMKSLFGIADHAREWADGDILSDIHSADFTLDSVTGLVRVLLFRWRLEQFMKTQNLDIEPASVNSIGRGLHNLLAKEKVLSSGETILAALFKEYTSDNPALWHCQYGFGYMELALRMYLKQGKEKGIRSELWKIILNYYHDFRDALEVHRELKQGTKSFDRASMLYAEAQSLHLSQKDPDPIIEGLLLEMKQFLHGIRFSYAKAPL